MAPRPAGPEGKADSYEAHLEALDHVIQDLEGDALSLEATIDRYKEGVAHLGSCRKILDAAEKRLAELVTSADGGVEERPLEVGADGLVDAGVGPSGGVLAGGGYTGNGGGRSPRPPPRAKPPAGAAPAAPPPSRPVLPPADAADDLPF